MLQTTALARCSSRTWDSKTCTAPRILLWALFFSLSHTSTKSGTLQWRKNFSCTLTKDAEIDRETILNWRSKSASITNAHLLKVSVICWGVVAKSNAQKDWGSSTSAPLLTSVGGCVKIGAALPKNGYVYLKTYFTHENTCSIFSLSENVFFFSFRDKVTSKKFGHLRKTLHWYCNSVSLIARRSIEQQ